MTPPTSRALIFDVFGTLVDWRTGIARAVRAALGPGIDAEGFADAWRAEYDPAMATVRAGGRRYVALEVLHRENLARILPRFGQQLDDAAAARLTDAWERLPPWAEVPAALSRLRATHLIAPCSNGSIALMVRLARHAGLPWDCILGAEIARDYKPNPAVYRAACAALRLPPAAVTMVAAHNADLAAARACGLRTAFFPRPTEHGPGQASDLVPDGPWDYVARDLADLADQITG